MHRCLLLPGDLRHCCSFADSTFCHCGSCRGKFITCCP
ncbi:hypothetical protein AB205_0139330 [Aquarana catesbeiana]|uniref:Uncharacterized protein n=1 Tax=Aquarana catesbeiana TaxID=8400 RepID=A0A2G9S1X8_AQUCT|nr:hypothetical protein AB205_0139330 [Aquarana catesbeiana]